MLKFVGRDDDLRGKEEGPEDEGEDGGLDGVPRGGRFGVLSPGSAELMNERQCREHLREALIALQEVDDEVGGRVGGYGGNEVDGSGEGIMQRK